MARNDLVRGEAKPGLGGLLARGQEFAKRLTPMQKIGLGAVLLTVVAGVLVLGRTATSTSMSPLYTDLQSADASAVVDALAAKSVSYQLTDAGHTVLVPTSQVYDLRVSLAGAGLPSSSQGYSLLDKQGITTSDFRQKIDYQRALEGELDKTLEAMDGIQSAAVHLALPEESVFVDTPTNPTASVLLVGSALDGINPDAVDAVVHLVASAVKNLKPADVTVIDSNGAVLSSSGMGSTGVSGATGRTKAIAAFEQRMSAALTSLLARTTGAGNVAVTVTADLNLDEVQSTSEDYGPIGTDEGTYVLAEQTADETYANGADGTNGTAGVLGPDGGVVSATTLPATAATTTPVTTVPAGTATTVPATTVVGSATTLPAATGTASTVAGYGSSSGSRTYAVDKVVEQITTAPGAIQQLHVAILLDDAKVTAAQATAIQDLVTTAAGIDAGRGDSVMVTRLPFDTSAAIEAAALAKADTAAKADEQKTQMIRTLAIAGVVVIALLLAYRSARRARRLTATPINIGEIGIARRPIQLPPELTPATTDHPLANLGDRNDDTMGEIATLAERRPEDVANVLRTWLAESQQRRP